MVDCIEYALLSMYNVQGTSPWATGFIDSVSEPANIVSTCPLIGRM